MNGTIRQPFITQCLSPFGWPRKHIKVASLTSDPLIPFSSGHLTDMTRGWSRAPVCHSHRVLIFRTPPRPHPARTGWDWAPVCQTYTPGRSPPPRVCDWAVPLTTPPPGPDGRIVSPALPSGPCKMAAPFRPYHSSTLPSQLIFSPFVAKWRSY